MEDGASTERSSLHAAIKLPPSSSTSTSTTTSPANGPRPHRCEICQRSFREVATLRKHEQLHRADRPYVCQTCAKSFLWSSNLKVHERVHTGERPYKCKICHRCFTQSNDLRRHERNVHMRGKLYGYKQGSVGVGRGVIPPAGPGGGSHVNLAAYQAFAMQQRALLHQAMTYDFLQSAAVTQAQMFPQAPGPGIVHKNDGSLVAFPGASGNSGLGLRGEEGPTRRDMSQRSPIKLEQVTPPTTPGEGELIEKRGMGVGPPPHGPPDAALHSPVSPRYIPSSSTCPAPHPMTHPTPLVSPPMLLAVGSYPGGAGGKDHHSPLHPSTQPPDTARSSILPSFSSFRHPPHSTGGGEYEGPDQPPAHPHRGGERENHTPHPHHPHHQYSSHHPHHPHHHMGEMHRSGSRGSLVDRGERERDGGGGGAEDDEMGDSRMGSDRHNRDSEKYPCDSVMDLSISKTPDVRPGSGPDKPASSTESGGGGRRSVSGSGDRDSTSMPPPKPPSCESECEGKRDVTTTSATPVADNGIHHCQHCNIFFYDYTMFHLHESLHLPFEEYPFRCPSCGKHCQDRVEFMFHTVWHVKYPHTIPNYHSFKDNFIS